MLRSIGKFLRQLSSPQRRKRSPQRSRRAFLESLERREVFAANTIGLTMAPTEEAYDGYNLFSTGDTNYLINMEGEKVHEWSSRYDARSAYMQPDGSLIRTITVGPDEAPTVNFESGNTGGIEKLDWNNNSVWKVIIQSPKIRAHHDIEVLPNGNVLAIAWETKTRQEAIDNGRDPATLPGDYLFPDSIVEVNPNTGKTVWRWSIWDHLIQDFDATKKNYGDPSKHPELIDINYFRTDVGAGGSLADWTHCNSVDYNAELDQIILSSREFSEFWIIDHSTSMPQARRHTGGKAGKGGDLLYRYGNPEAYGQGDASDRVSSYQHDPEWIADGSPGAGNILFFNNGWNRTGGPGENEFEDYSSVDEVRTPIAHQWMLNNDIDQTFDDQNRFDTPDIPADWIPITGDWDGDGDDTAGWLDPRTGNFHLRNSKEATEKSEIVISGLAYKRGWLPVAGDWDGDGTDGVGLYNPNSRLWRLTNLRGDQVKSERTFQTPNAAPKGIPLAGDWDGDGKDSVGVYSKAGRLWQLTDNTNKKRTSFQYVFRSPASVKANFVPLAGDWDNDGKDTIGVYNPAKHTFLLNNKLSTTRAALAEQVKLRIHDVPESFIPLAGDWDRDGIDSIGMYDPNWKPGTYRLTNGNYGPKSLVYQYTSTPKSDFFAKIISGAQRLPNGNTLINEGTEGRFFEVTPDGRIVWEYINPVDGVTTLNQGEHPSVASNGFQGNRTFRVLRYDLDYLNDNLELIANPQVIEGPRQN